jgi:hypothetical protein
MKIKRDKYKSARGGYSRLVNLHCRKCDQIIALYQKDGPGNLRRTYMDRILAPEMLIGLEKQKIKSIKNLTCSNCNFVVGIPYVYQKESRNAFRIFQDSVIKE